MKKKKCKVCKKMEYIFSKGRCQSCARIEYQKKYEEKRKKKTEKQFGIKESISFLKKQVPTKRHKEAKDAERLAMKAYWKTQEDITGFCFCAECGTCLGGEFNPYNVAHIISKGSNPAFRCDMRNFILLCADHHHEFDSGKRSEMNVFEITEEVRIRLRNEDSNKL